MAFLGIVLQGFLKKLATVFTWWLGRKSLKSQLKKEIMQNFFFVVDAVSLSLPAPTYLFKISCEGGRVVDHLFVVC